ncbi:MAG: DUF4386 domain-containing protein, partial [Bacteroidota bacterium]|nr:DUF4386 domain-containing protein [Bacteroidota bacterium]
IDQNLLDSHIILSFTAFRSGFSFSILLFSFHLLVLGYLVFVSTYIPKILGILLIISGLGYLLTSLKPLILPNINTDFAVYTFYGELIFMIWLIYNGLRKNKIEKHL